MTVRELITALEKASAAFPNGGQMEVTVKTSGERPEMSRVVDSVISEYWDEGDGIVIVIE